MNTFYQNYPEFIDTDPRTDRPADWGYAISADMMESRHLCMLPPDTLKDKSVLDLGSCVGYTGAWALHNGASRYCGVEFSEDFVELSRENLKKHFSNKNWSIEHQSIEDFFKSNSEKFDIVIASGIIYSFTNPAYFLDNLTRYADTCIIESIHPWNVQTKSEKYNLIPHEIFQSFRESPHWEAFIENEPFTILGKRKMIIGAKKETMIYTGCGVSLGYLKRYMTISGYSYDPSVYGRLKKALPDTYNKLHRFASKFIRNNKPAASRGFVQSITTNPPNIEIKPWNN